MTPRQKNGWAIAGVIVAALAALGGIIAYARTDGSTQGDLKAKIEAETQARRDGDNAVIQRLDRMENKIDRLIERGRK